MSLIVQIVPGSPAPIYRQIVDQVCAAVAAGRLGENEALPSVRALADEILVNPNTVAKAYAELSRVGIVESRAGKGIFVAQRRQVYTRAERQRRLEPALNALISEAVVLALTPDEIIEAVEEKVQELNRKVHPKGASR